MRSIYKNEAGRKKVFDLYDAQLKRLQCSYHDRYVNTTYGKTHLIETGVMNGMLLLVFHGGNTSTAYNLLACDFLLTKFHVFAVDTIGHPGKSAETCLSPRNETYGKWVSEVISGLGFQKIRCFGGSFGAGILVKTMGYAPEMIERAVLYVPAGINNAPAIGSMKMMVPMILYWLTGKEEWLKNCILPMAVTPDNIDSDIFETARCSIDYVKIKAGMPSNVPVHKLKRCFAPTLIMAAEKDCLFPAKRVIPRAKEALPNCETYLLENRGHMNHLTEEEKQKIVEFLLEER